MISSDIDYGTIHAKACIAANTRPFFWVGLACMAYGYVPYALHEIPLLYYLGLGMTGLSIVVRALSSPIIACQRMLQQVRTGKLRAYDLGRKAMLLCALVVTTFAGAASLGKVFTSLAGLD